MGEVVPFNRMYPMRYHAEQARLWASSSRYNVVPAGRRSGKTEICGKRKVIMKALQGSNFPDPRFFCAAPTRDQAKRIYWKDLKLMTPKEFITNISETMLCITLANNTEIHVLGMDKPERIEGSPWDGGVLDEYGNMKPETWGEHVRPALSDRQGWVDFIGVPEGRNHYYDLYKDAQEKNAFDVRHNKSPEWNHFHWFSADILPASEIEAAKRDLDELTFQQEYEASFVSFSGRAYYPFDERLHTTNRLHYDPAADLEICLDFNVSPGIAVVVQEQWLPTATTEETWGDGVIGEVYIPRNSNTVAVCNKLIQDWGDHEGTIYFFGDFTGGSKGSAKIQGSDWQIVKDMMHGHFSDGQCLFRVKPNPRERDRVNSVNSRLLSINNDIRMMFDSQKAKYTIRDMEGVALLEGGSGEIDKKKDVKLTHLSDALGYRVWEKYPVKRRYVPSGQRFHK